ncbi:MAG: immunoglobulin domain-containing protein, partial [Opitutaceae bacterium]
MNFSTLFWFASAWTRFVLVRICWLCVVLACFVLASRAADTATVATGENITFVVTSDGTPAPSFQWRKNGNVIAGATAGTFSITNASLSDGASYRVTATNEVGSADSPDFALQVTLASAPSGVAPAITSQPVAPSTAMLGGTVSLSIAANGSPAPTFQWFKGGVAMSGSTGSTLSLVNLTSNDNGTYSVAATNTFGSAMSSSITMTVTSPSSPPPPTPPPPVAVAPVFTQQPNPNQTVATGASVSFVVEASGIPAPSIQWQRNGVPIIGATSTALPLVGATTTDNGSYVAVATNSAGSASSNPAVLVVSPTPPPPPVTPTPPNPPPVSPPSSGGAPQAPLILNQPIASQPVVAGSSATIAVSATGNPTPSFQWRKNGTDLIGATNATLSIGLVTARDAATYVVMVSNASGTVVSGNAVLVVISAPLFLSQPTTQAVTNGAKATFSTSVSAIPGADLQWTKDGALIPGATKSILTIDSVRAVDLGVYSVVATNAVGTAKSVNAMLVIAAPPVFTAQPASQTAAARSDVTFVVSASGGPVPTFQWKKNGVVLPGATNSTLILRGVEKSDEGSYVAEATNAMGWALSNRATLVVNTTSGQGTSGGQTPVGVNGPATGARIVNLSVRAKVGGSADALIVGFVINGSAPKPMLLRGVGPTLSVFGVADTLPDPMMALYSGASITSSNDDWRMNINASQIAATSESLGAFSLPESGADAVILTALDAGAYTVVVNGRTQQAGVALVEVYDAAPDNPASLVNLSVRTHVGAGADAPNVGFVITGTT